VATISNDSGTKGVATAVIEGLTLISATMDGIDSNDVSLTVTYITPEYCKGALTFVDSNLEAAIREKISKPTGDITFADVRVIYDLSAGWKNISDISGIEYPSPS